MNLKPQRVTGNDVLRTGCLVFTARCLKQRTYPFWIALNTQGLKVIDNTREQFQITFTLCYQISYLLTLLMILEMNNNALYWTTTLHTFSRASEVKSIFKVLRRKFCVAEKHIAQYTLKYVISLTWLSIYLFIWHNFVYHFALFSSDSLFSTCHEKFPRSKDFWNSVMCWIE